MLGRWWMQKVIGFAWMYHEALKIKHIPKLYPYVREYDISYDLLTSFGMYKYTMPPYPSFINPNWQLISYIYTKYIYNIKHMCFILRAS